jgi:membrane fusion protein (multidrug efflux system)
MSTQEPINATPNAQAADGKPANGNGNGNGKRRGILLIIGGVFVLGAVIWVLLWLLVFSRREVTDNAYIGGNQVGLSAQINGTVIAVLADDTQRVSAGQTLVQLDPTDTDVALAKARSALAQAVRQVRQQTNTAAQYDAAIAQKRLALQQAQADLSRRVPLLADHAIAPEDVTHARDTVAVARASLDLAQRQADAAHSLVDGADIADNPAVAQARAAFREAWVAASRNAIVAPVDGYVAERSVQVGSRVIAGQSLLKILPLGNLWVDANFKEGQLRKIRIGQPAEITTDIYGGDFTFHGHVAGLAAGTGAAFALLPPQNASGNWIKVVQRVPVRIALDPKELAQHPLRVGLSSEVTVRTTDTSGPVLAQSSANAPESSTQVYQRDLAKADAEADAVISANLGTH